MTIEGRGRDLVSGRVVRGSKARARRIVLAPLEVDDLTESEVIQHVLDSVSAGRGGWIAPVNLDVLVKCASDVNLLELVRRATFLVADGAPLLWASRIAGRPLPSRVAGSDLIYSLSAAAAAGGQSIFLLGGAVGVPEQAADRLADRYPGLRVAGSYSPPMGFEQSADELAEVSRRLAVAEPAIVFVGLGFPKQERLIVRLREELPGAWFLACGAAIPFAAGELARAPRWMQRAGLEWTHRLVTEPRRLARRYLIEDLPYAVRLLVRSVGARMSPAMAIAEQPALDYSQQVEVESVIDLRETIQPYLSRDEVASAAQPAAE